MQNSEKKRKSLREKNKNVTGLSLTGTLKIMLKLAQSIQKF